MALEIVFWVAVGLIVYTHVGYPLALVALRALRRRRPPPSEPRQLPAVSLIVAAHDEEEVIASKLADALALDYPHDRLQLIVASDGSRDRTAEVAREAGADLVLDLPRSGKLGAQNAAVERAGGEILAFSDANSYWRPSALRRLVARFEDPEVGYVCGQVRYAPRGRGETSQEGLYWRYEMKIRELESDLAGVTGGNGGIYATRRRSYLVLEPSRSHDLNFPFQLSKGGWKVVYAPDAVAEERMVPTLEGEFARKRRMNVGLWDIVIRDGMLDPRGYRPLYAFQIASHRLLRYLSPLLHLVAFGTNIALLGEGTLYLVIFALQVALLAAAVIGWTVGGGPLRIVAHYVSVTASIAAGLWDRMRFGAPGSWEKPEGTR
jgi:cellulose synthase/poly-beta-1,6-N-acetylglucosamine synthase-like glycosyltransferase